MRKEVALCSGFVACWEFMCNSSATLLITHAMPFFLNFHFKG